MERIYEKLFTFLSHHEINDNPKCTNSELKSLIRFESEKKNSVFLKCDKCSNSKKYKNPLHLRMHYECFHEGKVRFKCSLCHKKTYYKHTMKAHQIKKHNNETCTIDEINCQQCKKGEAHINCERLMEIPETKIKCSVSGCKFTSNSKRTYQEHHENIHQRIVKYECNICFLKSYRSVTIKNHQLSNHTHDLNCKVIRIGCKLCEESSNHIHKRGVTYENSKHSNHDSKGKLRDCILCTEKIDHDHLKKKQKQMKGKFLCNKCNYASNLKQHVKIHQKSAMHQNDGKNLRVLYRDCQDCQQNVEHNHDERTKNQHEDLKKKFKCSKCNYSSNQKLCVMNHQKTKFHQNDVDLKVLDRKIKNYKENTNKEDLINRGNNGVKRYSCSMCNYSSFRKQAVTLHQNSKMHKEDKKLKVIDNGCEKCIQKIEHKHRKIIRNKGLERYCCSMCSYSSYRRHYVLLHQNTKMHKEDKNLKVIDNDCEKRIQKIEHRHKKIMRNLLGTRFKCQVSGCNFLTNRKRDLKKHHEVIHQNVVRFNCNNCDYQHYYLSYLEGHQKAKHGDNLLCKIMKIGCKLCEENLPNHFHRTERRKKRIFLEKEIDPEFDGSKYSCGICDYKTGVKFDLSTHHKIEHLNLKRYKCERCDFKHYFMKEVQNHLDDHEMQTNILYLSCVKCDTYQPHSDHEYEAKETSYLYKEVKDFITCKECDHEPFKNFKLRVKHYRLEHKNKNIFNCKDCDYGSNYQVNLKTHINSKHIKKTFHCPKCSFQSTWKTAFLYHMREQHKQYQKAGKHFPTGKYVLCEECGESTYEDDGHKNHKCSGGKKLGGSPQIQ